MYNSVEECLEDDAFLKRYHQMNGKPIEDWPEYAGADPAHQKILAEAASFLSKLILQEKEIDKARLAKAEQQLMEKINASRSSGLFYLKSTTKWIAAAAVLVVVAGTILFFNLPAKKTILQTAYGEIRDEALPDGTTVTINANSKLSLGSNWQQQGDREVWLDGEAFFEVKKTAVHSRFIVHTSHFDIVVTGTRFNVINREGKNNVLLKEGSVIIHHSDGSDIAMKPGDYVEFSNNLLEKKAVQDKQVLAWKERKFNFENTGIREVAHDLEELYGVKVVLQGNAIENKTLSGIMPNDNLDVFLQSLEATQDFTVKKNGQEILIQSR